MSKATAIAHPIQGLLKYHGLRDSRLRLPLHDSISVCTAPFETRTTVEIRPDLDKDVFEIDSHAVSGREFERAEVIVEFLRKLTGRTEHVYMKSENNFMSNIGLGASASGFAALTLATHAAFEMNLTMRELTTIARVGAGSASRALAGGYSHWYTGTDHETSYAEMIADGENLPLGIVVAIIPAHKFTDNAHADAIASPFMACRVAYAKATLDDMRSAIINGDFSTVGMMAEKDSLSLHAATMTGPGAPLYWQPETMRVFHEVRRMREEGLEAYFSVDTGATVYINCRPQDLDMVEARIAALDIKTAAAHVGGPAHLTDQHLF